ncbi:hypothetical protein ACP70R_030052 [Stipagrostis hirtigluma subsp. patula]
MQHINKTVYISRRLILRQVMAQLKLDVHGSGYDPEAFRLKGWICMDVPRNDGSELKDKLKIYAEQLADTPDEAAETAALATLNYMCSFREVEINDFGKTLIQQKDEMMVSSKFWEEMFQEQAINMNKVAVAANTIYNTLITDIRKICLAFADVIPLTMLPDGLRAQNIATASFAVTSELNSPARMDQLAPALQAHQRQRDHRAGLAGLLKQTGRTPSTFAVYKAPGRKAPPTLFYIHSPPQRRYVDHPGMAATSRATFDPAQGLPAPLRRHSMVDSRGGKRIERHTAPGLHRARIRQGDTVMLHPLVYNVARDVYDFLTKLHR